MKREPTPEEQKWLEAICDPQKLKRNLRRTSLLIPIESIALALCIASLCIEGCDNLLCALSGILIVQILYLVVNRREIKQQLTRIEERESGTTRSINI